MSQNSQSRPGAQSRRGFLKSTVPVATIGALWAVICANKLLFDSPIAVPPPAEASMEAAAPVMPTVTAVPSAPSPTSTALPAPTEVLAQAVVQPTVTRPPTETVAPLQSAELTATPVPDPATPTVTSAPVSFADKSLVAVGEARRSYAGSSYSLATNIEVAARRIDGAILSPGGVFSFLDRIGPQTAEAGFKWGYGIMLVNGQAQTVPMMAGGICDVSTLLFQAVYKAGLTIVSRYAHSYWIASYGAPPDGSVGLEATVDYQPVDFRFANSTNDDLRVSLITAGGWMIAKLVGVHPGWKVAIAPPIVTNVVKTDRTFIRRPDPSLLVGAEVFVEQAQDGFDVTRERTVTAGDKVIDSYKYTTRYQPAHNVILVGGSAGSGPTTAQSAANGTPATTATVPLSPSETPAPPSPTPIRTTAASAAVPVLGGASVASGSVVLSWSVAGQLGPDDYFDVRVWQDGQRPSGIANVRQTSYTIGGGFPAGNYNWTVAVVRKQGGQIVTLTQAGTTLRFGWAPAGSAGGAPQR